MHLRLFAARRCAPVICADRPRPRPRRGCDCLRRLFDPPKGKGGFVGDGAVIDPQFNTTDVAVIVKTDLVTDKYYRHYERQLRDALD